MKAVLIHSFGPPDVLALEDIPKPTPQLDEVTVEIHAASVNPVDYKMREGRAGAGELPIVPGRDIAGVVEQIGAGVTRFNKGDAVYAMLDGAQGGYAEYAIVRERDLAMKPDRLDFVEAAAVPLAALTAWQGLFDHGRLHAGQHVLIHGGAGGVGHFAVQLARICGAMVATTVSQQDLQFVRELGADEAIDYRHENFEARVRDIDLVFDLVGGQTQARSWSVLKPGGTLISTVEEPRPDKGREKGIRAATFLTRPNGVQLQAIGRLIDDGRLHPHVQAVFSLGEAARAQTELQQRHTQGKIVLRVS